MTSRVFFSKIQEYYGSYRKGQVKEIAKYLSGRNEVYLDNLYKHCLYNFSSKWKSPPDIAVFEEFSGDALADAKRQIQSQEQLQIEEAAASREEQNQFLENLSGRLARSKRYPRRYE